MPILGRTEKRDDTRVRKAQPTPVRIVSAEVNLSVLTLTFDQPVVLKGTPQYAVDVALVSPLSASSPSIDTVAITFSADISLATEVAIPYVDPAVRSKDGGYVADSSFGIS